MGTTQLIEATEHLRLIKKSCNEFLKFMKEDAGQETSLMTTDKYNKLLGLCDELKLVFNDVIENAEKIKALILSEKRIGNG